MNTFDLHIHTKYSPCSNLDPEKILKITKKLGFTGIAITDHNTIQGALKTKQLNKDQDFELIIGEEIKTDKGEILAYYLNTEVVPGSFERVIDQLKDQGAIIAIAHPFSYGILRPQLKLSIDQIKNKIHAMETINGRMFLNSENKKAQDIAQQLNITQIAGSDAHFAFELGKARTLCNDSLRQVIKTKNTRVEGRISWSIFARALSVPTKYLNFP